MSGLIENSRSLISASAVNLLRFAVLLKQMIFLLDRSGIPGLINVLRNYQSSQKILQSYQRSKGVQLLHILTNTFYHLSFWLEPP